MRWTNEGSGKAHRLNVERLEDRSAPGRLGLDLLDILSLCAGTAALTGSVSEYRIGGVSDGTGSAGAGERPDAGWAATDTATGALAAAPEGIDLNLTSRRLTDGAGDQTPSRMSVVATGGNPSDVASDWSFEIDPIGGSAGRPGSAAEGSDASVPRQASARVPVSAAAASVGASGPVQTATAPNVGTAAVAPVPAVSASSRLAAPRGGHSPVDPRHAALGKSAGGAARNAVVGAGLDRSGHEVRMAQPQSAAVASSFGREIMDGGGRVDGAAPVRYYRTVAGDNGYRLFQFDQYDSEWNSDLWWFNGATPPGYATEVMLNVANGQEIGPTIYNGPDYHWKILQGQDKVQLHLGNSYGNEFYMGEPTGMSVVSIAPSTAVDDVVIQVTLGTLLVGTAYFTAVEPHQLVSDGAVHEPWETGYQTYEKYHLLDQMGNAFPDDGLFFNEKFIGDVVDDYPGGSNWVYPQTHGELINPQKFVDRIASRATVALGVNPEAENPQGEPGYLVKVNHIIQEFYCGGVESGEGVLIQRDVNQMWIDHGSHEQVVSPVPAT